MLIPGCCWRGALHERNGFSECKINRELLKPVLLLLHANKRINDFNAWYHMLAGLNVRQTTTDIINSNDRSTQLNKTHTHSQANSSPMLLSPLHSAMSVTEFVLVALEQAHAFRFLKNPATYATLILQFHIESLQQNNNNASFAFE